MEEAKILFLQVLVMFILTAVGFVLFKTGKITKAGSKSIGNILIYVSLPIVIFNGFLVENTKERLIGLLISAIAAITILFVGMLFSNILNKKDPIANFASCFSNPGFFGIPLITATLVEGSVFYIATFIACLNILQWSYGVYLMTKDKKNISIKKIFKAPAMIAFIIGLFFFFTQIKISPFFKNTMSYLSNLNTPLAMFTIGIYLAQTDLLKLFKRPSNYFVALIRLILIPIIAFGILCIIPNTYIDLKIAILIAASCPVGSNIAVFAEMNDKDYPYAVETVVISTLLSIITIPLLVMVAHFIWTI